MIDIQQKWQSQSPKDWFLSVCGLIVLLVGMGGLLLQLLSPLTMIGSVNYIVMGASILFVYSHNARSIGYSLLPDNVKYAVFDMSLLDTLTKSTPHWQLLAFFVACMTMPGEDVQELSKLLPPTFNRFKDNNIAQVITGCAIVTHPTTFVPGKSPQRLLAAAGKSDDQFTGHVVDAGIQSMKRLIIKESTKHLKQSLSSFISSANILACLTTFGIVGGSLACWWKELLRSSYRGDLLLRYAQKYIKSGTHYLQHLLHTADIPLIALAVASGSMAFLGVNDAVRAIRNPNAAMRMISSGSLSHVRPPEPENESMISAKVSQSECLLFYRLDSSIIVSCHSRDSRSRTTSNACLHELMHTLRRFAQFTENKAVEGATYAVLSFPTDHAGCDQRSAVLICATLLCLCARALRGSLSRNRWVVCAVYSRLCKVHDAGTRKT